MTTQFKPGDRVIRNATGTEHTISTMRANYVSCYQLDNMRNFWFAPEELTPIDPPTPKRVEVVTETKTVDYKMAEFTMRLPLSRVRMFCETTWPDDTAGLRESLLAALTEQSNG